MPMMMKVLPLFVLVEIPILCTINHILCFKEFVCKTLILFYYFLLLKAKLLKVAIMMAFITIYTFNKEMCKKKKKKKKPAVHANPGQYIQYYAFSQCLVPS